MVQNNKKSRKLLRKHHYLRESSSEDELCVYFTGAQTQHINAEQSPESLSTTIDYDKYFIKDGHVLTIKQMKYLKNSQYEYNAAAGSILEKLFMQRFWCWASTFVPLSVMPCTITAIGFILNLFTSSILIYYSPNAIDPVPTWTMILAAIGVFLYQTADALDGKQCYKVQNCQIEEFYDHACDSVSTILLMYSVGITTQCGRYPLLTVILIFSSLIAFWSTHWQCYITNQMIFGYVDVTEAQFIMIIVHLCSALFGQQIWNIELIHFMGHNVYGNQLLAIVTLVTLFRSIWLNCQIVLIGSKTPLEIAGALPYKRREDTLRPLLPIVLLTFLLSVNWCLLSKSHQQQKNGEKEMIEDSFLLVTFLAVFGTSIAKLTMRLVLAHCTNDHAPIVDLALLPPAMLLLTLMTPLASFYSNWLIFFTMLSNSLILAHFFIGVGFDMQNAMDVRIFSLKYLPGHPKNRTSQKGIYINGLNNSQILSKMKYIQ